MKYGDKEHHIRQIVQEVGPSYPAAHPIAHDTMRHTVPIVHQSQHKREHFSNREHTEQPVQAERVFASIVHNVSDPQHQQRSPEHSQSAKRQRERPQITRIESVAFPTTTTATIVIIIIVVIIKYSDQGVQVGVCQHQR